MLLVDCSCWLFMWFVVVCCLLYVGCGLLRFVGWCAFLLFLLSLGVCCSLLSRVVVRCSRWLCGVVCCRVLFGVVVFSVVVTRLFLCIGCRLVSWVFVVCRLLCSYCCGLFVVCDCF